MKCPYCNKEMQKGIISAGGSRSVIWRAEDEQSGLLSDTERLRLAKFSWFGMSEIKAFYCDDCKKMIIDMENAK